MDYDTWKTSAPEPMDEPLVCTDCKQDADTRLPKWIDRDESPICSSCLQEYNPEL